MVKRTEISKATLIHTFPLNPFAKILKQILSICSTVLPMLLKLYDIVSYQSIPCSQGKVDGVGGLCLQGLMDRVDILY